MLFSPRCLIPLLLGPLVLQSLGGIPLRGAETTFKSLPGAATLIELYSSEGCSSCPPAEAWINEQKSSPRLWADLFPVVFHVDYWDGLGWADRFARPAYTARQRAYAAHLGQDSVYTPEFVVDGHEWRGWFQGEKLPPVRVSKGELTLSIGEAGRSVSASYSPVGPQKGAAYTLNVALLGMGVVIDVKGGENGGRQLRHDFVVLNFQTGLMGENAKESGAVSGLLSFDKGESETPHAVVGWVSTPDGSIEQIAGGWLH